MKMWPCQVQYSKNCKAHLIILDQRIFAKVKALEESYTENLGPNQRLLEKLSEKQEEDFEADPRLFDSEIDRQSDPYSEVSEGNPNPLFINNQ